MDLSVFGNDAHVGCGVTQGEAAGLGEHDGIGVAHAGAFEVENLTDEGYMRPLRQEFGVEDEAVVAHAALVEDFGVENEEATEFGAYLGEVDTPLDEIFVGRDDLVHIELVDAADEVRTADEDFAFVASVSGECLFGDVDEVFLGELFLGVEGVFLAGLPPDTAGERNLFFLFRVVDAALHAEHEGFLHAQSHVVDGRFFGVGKFPFHLFVGDFLERRLLDLHLEDLAIVLVFYRQSLELGGLHVELGGGASHADKGRALRNRGHAAGDVADGLAVDGIDVDFAGLLLARNVEYEVGFRLGFPVALIAFHSFQSCYRLELPVSRLNRNLTPAASAACISYRYSRSRPPTTYPSWPVPYP